jgi:hypothetical protein
MPEQQSTSGIPHQPATIAYKIRNSYYLNIPQPLRLDLYLSNYQYLQSIPGLSPMTTVAAGAPSEISGRIPPNGCIHLGSGTFELPI